MAATTRIYKIVETATGETVREISTDKIGSSLDRFEEGLFRKIDFDRFHIDYPENQES